MTLCVWLLSLRIVFSRFIHVIACIISSFLLIAKCIIFHYMSTQRFAYWQTNIVCLSTGGYLGCPHFLAIVNNAAMHIYVQVCVNIYFPFLLGIYLGEELLSHRITLVYLFENCQTFFLSSHIILYYTQQCMSPPVFQCPNQHVLSSVSFLIVAMEVGVKWYLTIQWLCS